MAAHRRKTWREKLADKRGMPKMLRLEEGFPCDPIMRKLGAEAHRRLLEREGFEVFPRGKRDAVVDYARSLYQPRLRRRAGAAALGSGQTAGPPRPGSRRETPC